LDYRRNIVTVLGNSGHQLIPESVSRHVEATDLYVKLFRQRSQSFVSAAVFDDEKHRHSPGFRMTASSHFDLLQIFEPIVLAYRLQYLLNSECIHLGQQWLFPGIDIGHVMIQVLAVHIDGKRRQKEQYKRFRLVKFELAVHIDGKRRQRALHKLAQIRLVRPDLKVEMVRHQAIAVNNNFVQLSKLHQFLQKQQLPQPGLIQIFLFFYPLPAYSIVHLLILLINLINLSCFL